MSKSYVSLSTEFDTFGALVTRVNDLSSDLSSIIVTTAANTTGGGTSGNGYIVGIFGANTLVAGVSIRGGSITTPGVLTLSSNLSMNTNTFTTSGLVGIGNTTPGHSLSVGGNVFFANSLGINNTSPSHNLSVNGTTFLGANISLGGNVSITANGTVGTVGQVMTVGANGAIYWNSLSSSVAGANTQLIFNNAGVYGGNASLTYNIATNTLSTPILSVSTNTASIGTVLYSYANGNIGIGNNAPAHGLSVNPAVFFSNNVGIANTAPTHRLSVNGTTFLGANLQLNTGVYISANGGVGSLDQVMTVGATGVYWKTPTGAGVAGANTQIPFNDSGVYGANTNLTYNTASNTLSIPILNASNSISTATATLTTNTFTVGTIINSYANGNIGISNTSPAHKLSINGTLRVSANAEITNLVANGSLGTSGQILTSAGAGGSYWAPAPTGGATLVSNTTHNSSYYFPMSSTTTGAWSNGVVTETKLYFNPSTGTLNSTVFNSLSDEKFKTNVEDIDNGLDIINSIRAVEFNWKESGKMSAGVIAQEIEKILPHVVSTEADSGTKSVNYPAIIAYLISAIQELSLEVNRANGI